LEKEKEFVFSFSTFSSRAVLTQQPRKTGGGLMNKAG